MRLKDKTAIVTGGGKGIGFGIVQALVEEGAQVVITGRTEETLKKAQEKIKEKYDQELFYVAGDGAKEETAKKIVEETISKFGKINLIVNNAQASKSGLKLIEHSKEDFDLAINSGLYSTFFLMKEAFPYLKESKGTVINFASGAGISGKDGQSSYAAAKEGIRGLSRVAATEWGEFGINVNVICPLAMTESLEAWKEEYPELYEKTIQAVPMKRFADPKEDIGKTIVFLASDGHYITGETISLQGGSGLRP